MDNLVISIIVGSKNAPHTLLDCISSIAAQTTHLSAEIILVDNSKDEGLATIGANFPDVMVLEVAPAYLVPHLWKIGFDQATGNVVAFTNAQCVPNDTWVANILSTLDKEGVHGVGGPIHGPESGKSLDWGLYFSRYSAFLPPGPEGPVADVAGDNAAYEREALMLCEAEMQAGFWEVLVHVALHKHGKQLVGNPKMGVRLGRVSGLKAISRMRFQHGRYFGSTRGESPIKKLLLIIASPLIAPLLLSRIFLRVRSNKPEWMKHLLISLPVLLILLIAWGLGEASGYLIPQDTDIRWPQAQD